MFYEDRKQVYIDKNKVDVKYVKSFIYFQLLIHRAEFGRGPAMAFGLY